MINNVKKLYLNPKISFKIKSDYLVIDYKLDIKSIIGSCCVNVLKSKGSGKFLLKNGMKGKS